MKVYFASDHAGYKLKNALVAYVRDSLNEEVEDCGPFEYDDSDDYPVFVDTAVRKVAEDVQDGEDSRAIILGASGQGEAMAANRFKGIRAAVYYGPTGAQIDASGGRLTMIQSTRAHNDSNVLSLGARFLSEAEAREAVKLWVGTAFSGEERHVRRIKEIDALAEKS